MLRLVCEEYKSLYLQDEASHIKSSFNISLEISVRP